MAHPSKDTILRAVRAAGLPPRELPDLNASWSTYADRAGQFAAALRGVGGRYVPVAQVGEIAACLAEHPAWSAAKKIASLLPQVVPGNVDLAAIDDPHHLADVDFALLPGQFAVAENAAIWVTDRGLRHRALYFIVQHLVLVVPAREIVDTMHQAYQRLAWGEPGYGLFLSGPSKTADIEQSLVIGAHGPRSLTVFGVADEPSAMK